MVSRFGTMKSTSFALGLAVLFPALAPIVFAAPVGTTVPAALRIRGIRLDPSGRVLVESDGAPGTYLRLHRSESLSDAGSVVALALSPTNAGGTVEILDPMRDGTDGDGSPLAANRFYRLASVSVESSDDSDSDGLPDVFELRAGPPFDPLDPADGNADPDADGLGAAEEFLRKSDPFVADTPGVAGARMPQDLSMSFSIAAAIRKDGTLWTWGDFDVDPVSNQGVRATQAAPERVELPGGMKWKAVAVGGLQQSAIDAEGRLWSWTVDYVVNATNQLRERRQRLREYASVRTWKAVSAGASHSLAVADDGSLWAWGVDVLGEMGRGTVGRDAADPVRIDAVESWVAVSAGDLLSLGLTADGRVWAWGSFDGLTVWSNRPKELARHRVFRSIAAAGLSAFATASDGSLWAWGTTTLGDGPVVANPTPETFREAQLGVGTSWSRVAASMGYRSALADDGRLFEWGDLASTSAGTGATLRVPTPVSVEERFAALAVDASGTVARTRDGRLVTRAFGTRLARIGDATRLSSDALVPVAPGTTWRQAFAGERFSAAINAAGDLHVWGTLDGLLRRSRGKSEGAAGSWARVAAGWNHLVAIDTAGALWSMGANGSGQLGNGAISAVGPWQRIGGSRTWASVGASENHSAAVGADGTLWTWGLNARGQLGDGSITSRPSPVQVGTGRDWRRVACGNDNTYAMDADGRLWSAGLNNLGQRGLAAGVNPTRFFDPVDSTASFLDVRAGDGHVVALSSTGDVVTFGASGSGQLGRVPLAVGGGTIPRIAAVEGGGWNGVAAFSLASAGIDSQGRLAVWGLNSEGFLLPGGALKVAAPVVRSAERPWASVFLGRRHLLTVAQDGSLWAGGSNSDGQLGDGRAPFELLAVEDAVGWGVVP